MGCASVVSSFRRSGNGFHVGALLHLCNGHRRKSARTGPPSSADSAGPSVIRRIAGGGRRPRLIDPKPSGSHDLSLRSRPFAQPRSRRCRCVLRRDVRCPRNGPGRWGDRPAGDSRFGGLAVFIEQATEEANLPLTTPCLGLEHIGLAVEDIEAAVAELKGKGVSFRTEIIARARPCASSSSTGLTVR